MIYSLLKRSRIFVGSIWIWLSSSLLKMNRYDTPSKREKIAYLQMQLVCSLDSQHVLTISRICFWSFPNLGWALERRIGWAWRLWRGRSGVDGLVLWVKSGRQPGDGEQEVREPVDVLQHLGVNVVNLDQRGDGPLGPAEEDNLSCQVNLGYC